MSDIVAIERQMPTPTDLLRIAVEKGADIETVERLLALKERVERDEARKAYVVAMNAFKVNPPEIIKNKPVAFKDVRYSYATLDQVCSAVVECMSRHGLSHRWRTEQENSLIRVTCIITHEKGHSEETTLSGPPDATGSKNAIQAISSTVSYLERYTLLAATGLAAAGQDNDAATVDANTTRIPQEEVQERCEYMMNSRTIGELNKQFSIAFNAASDAKDNAAMDRYTAVKKTRQRELL